MKKEVKIGIFTIAIIICTWGVLRFLGGSNLLSSSNTYYAKYENINGLQQSSQIFIRGVKVGVVSNISLDLSNNSEVNVELSIEKRYQIPTDSEAKIVGSGLMSPMAIEIITGESGSYLTSGDSIKSSREADLFTTASTELESLKSKLDEVTSELSTTLRSLNDLMVNNATHISGVITNMDSLTYNLNHLLTENESSVTRAVGGLADFTETLGNNSDQLDSIILNMNRLTRELSEANISTSLGESLTEVNSLLSKINRGEGNIGRIMADEELYNSLASASSNLDSLFFDMRQYPSRYVHFSVFGRDDKKQLEKAQKKAEREAKKADK